MPFALKTSANANAFLPHLPMNRFAPSCTVANTFSPICADTRNALPVRRRCTRVGRRRGLATHEATGAASSGSCRLLLRPRLRADTSADILDERKLRSGVGKTENQPRSLGCNTAQPGCCELPRTEGRNPARARSSTSLHLACFVNHTSRPRMMAAGTRTVKHDSSPADEAVVGRAMTQAQSLLMSYRASRGALVSSQAAH